MSKRVKVIMLLTIGLIMAIVISVFSWVNARFAPMADWERKNLLARDLFLYCAKHGRLPRDMMQFCIETTQAHCPEESHDRMMAYALRYNEYVTKRFLINDVTPEDVIKGMDYVTAKVAEKYNAGLVNNRLRFYLKIGEMRCFLHGREDIVRYVGPETNLHGQANGETPLSGGMSFRNVEIHSGLMDDSCRASDKNQIMDALLGQSQMPNNYGETMIALYRDESHDVLTRDFAVQHIGLYAQALERRGEYDCDSAGAKDIRDALFDAAAESRTIVAAAAFRALADMSKFDSRIDASRLNSLLANCAADLSSAPAARAMAVQLCGERRVSAARPALEAICADSSSPEILRRSASHSLAAINGH